MGRFLCCLIVAQSILPAVAADWSTLEHRQQSVARVDFDRLIDRTYCPSGALTNYLMFTTNAVAVFSTTEKTAPALFSLRFATNAPSPPLAVPPSPRIVLDPGHIGGEWA